jgi:hypothetical protein
MPFLLLETESTLVTVMFTVSCAPKDGNTSWASHPKGGENILGDLTTTPLEKDNQSVLINHETMTKQPVMRSNRSDLVH